MLGTVLGAGEMVKNKATQNIPNLLVPLLPHILHFLNSVLPVSQAPNFGAILACSLSLIPHIQSVSKSRQL